MNEAIGEGHSANEIVAAMRELSRDDVETILDFVAFLRSRGKEEELV